MSGENNARLAAACWTDGRRELLRWLEETAPPLAELYEGAVHLVFVVPLPGRLRLVSHAVREIRNGLPNYLAPLQGAPQLGRRIDANRLDNLAGRWERNGLPLDGSLPLPVTSAADFQASKPGVPISRRLFRHIAEIVRDHRVGREKKIDAAIRLFRAIAPENQELGDALRPIALQWAERTEWFMERTHASRETGIEAGEGELQKRFEEVEQVLVSVVGPIVRTLEGIRELVEDTNS